MDPNRRRDVEISERLELAEDGSHWILYSPGRRPVVVTRIQFGDRLLIPAHPYPPPAIELAGDSNAPVMLS